MQRINSKFFKPSEFECKCPRIHTTKVTIDVDFMHALDSLRLRLGRPVIVTSAVRCEPHNLEVGGRPDSAHLTGNAADITCGDSIARWEVLNNILSFKPLLFNRIGIDSKFIHLDNSPRHVKNVIWLYENH